MFCVVLLQEQRVLAYKTRIKTKMSCNCANNLNDTETINNNKIVVPPEGIKIMSKTRQNIIPITSPLYTKENDPNSPNHNKFN